MIGIDAMTSVAKLYYHQGRPFWESDQVEAIDCSNQYGNPSGHCFSSAGISLAVWLDYNTQARAPQSKTILKQWYWRVLFLCLSIGFVIAIAYSRMFLGVHSINQVLFGAQLGVWFGITSHYIVREPLMNLSENLIHQKESRLLPLFMVSVGLLLAVYAVQIINYEVVEPFQNPAIWSVRISENCGADKVTDAF